MGGKETILIILTAMAIIGVVIFAVGGYYSRIRMYQVDNKYVKLFTQEDGNQYVIISDYGFMIDPYK